MATSPNNCATFQEQLSTTLGLLKRDIIFKSTLIILGIGGIIFFAYSPLQIKISFPDKSYDIGQILSIIQGLIDIKIISELYDSIKKRYKLKRLEKLIDDEYSKTTDDSCELQTCLMMKTVFEKAYN